jgi:hypothetical protein
LSASGKDLRAGLPQHFSMPVERQGDREEESLIDVCESGFERDVYTELGNRGYRVIPQVKAGVFRIDMVVEGRTMHVSPLNSTAMNFTARTAGRPTLADSERWNVPAGFSGDVSHLHGHCAGKTCLTTCLQRCTRSASKHLVQSNGFLPWPSIGNGTESVWPISEMKLQSPRR